MRFRWLFTPALAALAIAAILALAACGGDDEGDGADTGGGGGEDDIGAVIDQLGGPLQVGEPAKGGTFRIGTTDFAMTDGFDPTGEYFGDKWGIYSNLMLRTLVSYPFTVADGGGNDLVPDLATEVPTPSEDGLTWTFTLKDGVSFAPPVNREITSQDIAYSMQRIATPALAAGYGFYYTGIEGWQEFADGKAETISGITTPDDKTIVFKLTAPIGDFAYRMAMPATAPIPQEVAKCYTQAAEYGRYVISSGPYMIDGSDQLDISSCATQKPISGFNPTRGLNLVRNPSYDAATDDAEVRQSNPDRFEFIVNTNLDNIFDQIEAGELEGSNETPTNAVLRRYLQDPDIRERLRVNPGDRMWYIYMNLTTPPFDDINVRKAMNLVMDLEGIQRSWGGPVAGEIPTNTLPDSLIGGQLPSTEYQPYQTPPFAGDVEAAKAEMAKSKYDTDKDGTCDAPACSGVVNLNRNFAPWSSMSPIIVQSAAQIGVEIETREVPRTAVNNAANTTARKIPFSSGNGWGKDYADPSTFMVLHDSRSIIPVGNVNFSLVGLKQGQTQELGVTLPEGGVPTVDKDIDACNALLGDERLTCWVNLDKKITETVVPWVPIIDATAIDLIGPSVSSYDFDQFSTEMALARVAVDPSLQK